MTTTLLLDPSQPYQIDQDLLACWQPPAEERSLAAGMVAAVDVCEHPGCPRKKAIARLRAVRIDARAERVVRDRDRLLIHHRDAREPEPPAEVGTLELEISTGVVAAERCDKRAVDLAPFFEAPLPHWLLDRLWARWRAPRIGAFDWRAFALAHWTPGSLLSRTLAFGEERPDRYRIGRATFQVDLQFCANPECDSATILPRPDTSSSAPRREPAASSCSNPTSSSSGPRMPSSSAESAIRGTPMRVVPTEGLW